MCHHSYEQTDHQSSEPRRVEVMSVRVPEKHLDSIDASCWAFPFLDLHYRVAPRRPLEVDSDPNQLHPLSRPSSSKPPLANKQTKRSASHSCLRVESTSSPTMHYLPKQSRNLQLPSFESLGIAVPAHTNKFPSQMQPKEDLTVSGSSPSSASHSRFSAPHTSPLPITPPEYDENISWNPNATGSPFSTTPTSEQPPQPAPINESSDQDTTPSSTAQALYDLTPPQKSAGQQDMSNSEPQQWPEKDHDAWVKDGYDAAVSSLAISTKPGEAVQIVSQTLPCPASGAPPSASPTASYVPVVQAIQNRLQAGQSPYINIIHAVPPKFNLSNLPTSPPSTPHLQFPGEDYFSCTVFSSAVPVPSYPYVDALVPQESAPAAHIPSPIVPPYSVHVSIMERYLPPTTPQEYQNMFSARGPSVLVDRLLELSPNDGNLVLIYPTKQGAQTFEHDYLSPILEPLLRHLVVMYRLPAEVAMTLGHLAAVPHMDDFDGMKCRVEKLCHDLNSRGKPGRRGSRFNVVYAENGGVQISRSLWTDWYIQQDTSRARAVLTGYLRNHRPMFSDAVSTGIREPPDAGAHVLRGFIEGIRQRSNEESVEPQAKLELGAFVIRRSRDS